MSLLSTLPWLWLLCLQMSRNMFSLQALKEHVNFKPFSPFACFKCTLLEGYVPSNYSQMIHFKTKRGWSVELSRVHREMQLLSLKNRE